MSDSFNFTGNINFSDAGANTTSGFLGSGTPSGTVTGLNSTGSQQLSGSGYSHTTVFEFTFTTSALSNVSISHDDGVSLFVSGNTVNDLLPTTSANPGSSGTAATLASLAANTYDLYYVETNGLPATLDFEYTPAIVSEPASLALLGAGLCLIGCVRRKKVAI